jgi:hypothetical protein
VRQLLRRRALVLWNATAPELWRRTTIYLRRALARLTGQTPTALARRVCVSYAKVAEYQARGAIHFHAVIRLDAAGDEVAAPPAEFTVERLDRAIREAAGQVAVPLPQLGDRPVRLARWGAQLDLRPLQARGELTAEAIAGYIASYATKATEDFGPALDRRLMGHEIDGLEVPRHVVELVRACWRLGGHPRLKELRLRQWAHMLGFRGHWQTKSRRYSITFTSLRRARAEYGRRRRLGNAVPLDAWGRELDGQAVIVLADWTYAGIGYRTLGDTWLAESAAAWAREQRQIAREEARTHIA